MNRYNKTVANTLSEGVNLSEKIVLRLLLIPIAAIYVVMALKVLGVLWPYRLVASSTL